MSKLNFSLIVILFSLCLIPGLTRPFSGKGEPREALTAQNMIKTGNYILPSRYGDEIPTKPPLFHWLIVASSKITGNLNEFSSRLPSVVLTVVLAIVFYSWINNPGIALTTLGILLTSFVWFRSAISSRIDLTLAFFLVLAFLEIYKWVNQRCKYYPVLLNLFISLAILSKGPIGIILPGIVLVAYQLQNKFKYELIENLRLLPSLIIPAIWYYSAYHVGGDNFIHIVMNENVNRVTGNMSEYGSHSHGIFYLFSTLLLGFLPWTFLLLFKPKKIILDSKVKFAILVSIIIFGFYCLPESKRDVYLLPAYPFLAFIIANIFKNHSEKTIKYYYISIFSLGIAGTIYTIVKFNPSAINYLWLLLPCTAPFFKTSYLNRLLILVGLLCCSFNNVFFKYEDEKKTAKSFAEELLKYPGKIYSHKERYYEISYYMNGKLSDIPKSIKEIKQTSGVLVEQEHLNSFLKKYKQNNLLFCNQGKKKDLCLYELNI